MKGIFTRTVLAKLNFILLVGFLIFPSLGNSAAYDDLIVKRNSKVNLAIIKFLQAGVTERDNNKADVGRYLCDRVGGASCYMVDSIGERICKAGGGSSCYLVDSIGEGLDRISKEDWYWDKFSDQYGMPQWRCRGSQTGQFANNSKCSGQIKDDERWPG